MRVSRWAVGAMVGGYAVTFVAKFALALRAKRRFPAPQLERSDEAKHCSDVTVVQPILSGDPGLERTLGHNLSIVPDARFVWLVDEADREGRRVTERLQKDNPNSQINIVLCPPAPTGVSPKSFKLGLATRDRSGTFLVLDDDTQLTAEGAAALIEALERCDLSTGLPQYDHAAGFPGKVLSQFVNNSSALTYVALSALGEPRSINGMAYALRSETLERIGGFAAIERELTDDLALARLLHDHGGCIIQTPYPQHVSTDVRGAQHYTELMHRWMRFALVLVARESPGARTFIAAMYGLPPLALAGSLLLGVAKLFRGELRPLGVVLGLLMMRAAGIATLQRRISGGVQWRPIASITAELLTPLHLMHAMVKPTIIWRGQRWRLRLDGTFSVAE
ncbi:ceramide glucosyltransferase [Leucobacter viscericola]|uniref:Ceramide glucosyltransferase n=1 Tax=Leucobacter viscericola TaxID=2714935 RepID=A0A6G7XBZ2_9MICO|nr:glycosyltransferase [Leucobacter viscericola]QIK61888.1 ceramide glucosyltransferase [Leucobacter viscericola]